MRRTRDPLAAGLVVLGLIAAATALASIAAIPHRSADGRAANDAILVGLALGGAAICLSRHRSGGDTHPLFVGTGLLAIALQTMLFDQRWIVGSSFPPWEETSVSAPGWFVGWLVAGAAFVLARPWWDRRGRAPIRISLVLGTTAAVLILADLGLLVLRHRLARIGDGGLRKATVFALTSTPTWVLGLATIATLGVAAWREARAGGGVRSPHPWLAAAWTIAAGAQVVLLARPVSYRPLFLPAEVLLPVAAALALLAFLAPQRAEASRARRATDRAQEVMGGRAEIAAMIAHEVRGPVTTIRGLAGTALAHYERLGDPERRELLELIDQESRRLLTTVTQASTALKVDASTLRYDIRPHDVGKTVREGVEAADLGDRTVTVDVPDGVQTPLDRRWLAEAVRQLVDNAAKFSPAETSIRVAVRADDRRVAIEISDRGPGVPTEQRERVFEKFATWRPDGYEHATGSGLGLFMVRGIVQAHGGDIAIVDAHDGGTMVRVRLPLEG